MGKNKNNKDRWVNLDNLPRIPNRDNKISWADSVGYYIPFKCGEYKGELLITNYKNNNEITISYNNGTLTTDSTRLSRCQG